MRKLFLIISVLAAVGGLVEPLALKANDILPVNDQRMMRSLNGTWQLKIDGMNDWTAVPVPSNWEAYGLCKPKYKYPEDIKGDYRTEFTVPAEWKGKRIIIRFDGVLFGYDLFVNNDSVGTWHSAYNTCIFDITDHLGKNAFSGENQNLQLHVYSQYKGYEFDCNDDWAPHGIFRDVTLFCVPETHVTNFMVTTEEVSRDKATVRFDFSVAGKGEIKAEIYAPNGELVERFSPVDGRYLLTVNKPRLWTAETPSLYRIRYCLYEKGELLQEFNQKFGIRKLTIEGNVIKLNGRPIKFRGVTCHSTDPWKVKVISDSLTLKDMKMMKEASINYIRTSHYPREPRFYDLADSLGFYVISEVPFGFGDKHLSDSSYADILYARAEATIKRDKAHACILIWSLGNENPLTKITEELGYKVKQLDPSRPICYPQVGSYFRKFNYKFPAVADIYTPHYPATGELKSFYSKADRPVIFTEYLHTLGMSFEDHYRQWETIQKTPCLAGGSVWEWVDQGMPFKEKLQDRYGYHEKVFTSDEGGFMMDGNQGTDGLLYANRIPLPNYYELRHNYSQVKLTMKEWGKLEIQNRFDFINLKDNVTINWKLMSDRKVIDSGSFSPDCETGGYVKEPLSNSPEGESEFFDLPHEGENLLRFDVSVVKKDGIEILNQSFVQNRKDLQDRILSSLLKSKNPMDFVQGTYIRAGRKATMAEVLKVGNQRFDRYIRPLGEIKIKTKKVGRATKVSYTLTPDTSHILLSEYGLAFLLNESIRHIQWIGNGPFATYPGRENANNYGFHTMQADDLYLEGNRIGVDAVLLTNDEGEGLLMVCDSANVSFEQTDKGIILTHNVAVSGMGPKFRQTAFPVWMDKVGTKGGEFYIYKVTKETKLEVLDSLFLKTSELPAPFTPFLTQYDTYLMHFDEILGEE